MKCRIKIANELLLLAKQLIEAAPTSTKDEFDKLSKSNIEHEYAKGESDDFPWKLLDTKDEVDAFIKEKSEEHPNLFESIPPKALEKLLDDGWFCIVSAGVNPDEDKKCKDNATIKGVLNKDEYKKQKHNIVDARYAELCTFLDRLNVPYYEIVGQYGSVAEKSYIVDLTKIGENNEQKVKSLFRQICSFCGNEMHQESIIEGIGKQQVIVYCKDRSHRKQIDSTGDYNEAMTQVYHDIHDRTQNTTWSGNFGDLQNSDWLDEK